MNKIENLNKKTIKYQTRIVIYKILLNKIIQVNKISFKFFQIKIMI